jgi:hypothetical protein
MGFELMVVIIEVMLFSYMMPCNLVDRYLHFRGIVASIFRVEEAFCPEEAGNRLFQIVSTCLPNYNHILEHCNLNSVLYSQEAKLRSK